MTGLLTDPGFYAVSIPAVLLMGLSKSGFGAGFGALAVPMMAAWYLHDRQLPHTARQFKMT